MRKRGVSYPGLHPSNLQKVIEWKRQCHASPVVFSQPKYSGQLNPARSLVMRSGWVERDRDICRSIRMAFFPA
jgi:hypothetical protein